MKYLDNNYFEKNENNIEEYIVVLRTFSLSDISFIKSVLEYEGIKFYIFGERLLEINTVLEPACLLVKKSDVKKVLKILKDIKLTYISTF